MCSEQILIHPIISSWEVPLPSSNLSVHSELCPLPLVLNLSCNIRGQSSPFIYLLFPVLPFTKFDSTGCVQFLLAQNLWGPPEIQLHSILWRDRHKQQKCITMVHKRIELFSKGFSIIIITHNNNQDGSLTVLLLLLTSNCFFADSMNGRPHDTSSKNSQYFLKLKIF